jgi:hypothetical protein
MMEQFLWKLDEQKVQQALIPGGLTGEHQFLHVPVKKPFKKYHCAEYHK